MQCSYPFASNSRPTPSNQTKTSTSNDHYEFKAGEVMEGYKVTRQLGEGTFGRVLEGEKKGRRYAIKVAFYSMKVIRPVQKYIESAKIEK